MILILISYTYSYFTNDQYHDDNHNACNTDTHTVSETLIV